MCVSVKSAKSAVKNSFPFFRGLLKISVGSCSVRLSLWVAGEARAKRDVSASDFSGQRLVLCQILIFGWPGLEGNSPKPRGFLRSARSSPGHPTRNSCFDKALVSAIASWQGVEMRGCRKIMTLLAYCCRDPEFIVGDALLEKRSAISESGPIYCRAPELGKIRGCQSVCRVDFWTLRSRSLLSSLVVGSFWRSALSGRNRLLYSAAR